MYVPQDARPAEIIPEVLPAKAVLPQFVYAGFWLRAVAYVIDAIIMSVAFAICASSYAPMFLKSPDLSKISLTNLPQLTPLAFGLTIVIGWLYYAVCESSEWQATPGKRLLRLYVTDLNGRRLSFGRATIRHAGKIISGLTFMVGYIFAGFTERKQALHDIIAGCLVLRRR